MTGKLSEIIINQFDMEISIRKKELKLIRDEIELGKTYLEHYRNKSCPPSLLTSPSVSRPSSPEFSRNLKRTCAEVNRHMYTADSAPTRRIASIFAKRFDGTFVRFRCCVCQKADFTTRVGFINHCRNSHNLILHGIDEYVQKCGVPVDESEVPADDPSRWETAVGEFALFDDIAQKNNSEAVGTEIKEFRNEDVLDDCSTLSSAISSDDDDDDDDDGDKKMSAFLPSSILLGNENEEQEHEDEDEDEEDVPETSIGLTPLGLPSNHIQKESHSRFYIKRRILIGNYSKYIPEHLRQNPLHTHKWMLYVKCPNADPRKPNDIYSFVKSVRFYLHPSYKPNDILQINEPPFQISQSGWGEFPIRIRLIFWDEDLNRPVDMIHRLELTQTFVTRSIAGPEAPFDIELDRKTKFLDLEGYLPDIEYCEMDNEMVIQNPQVLRQEANLLFAEQERSKNDVKEIPLLECSNDDKEIKKTEDTVAQKRSTGTFCKYCGSRTDIIRFDWGVDTQRSDQTARHDPNKCQFRPVTKKGKLRSIFSSLTKVSSLIEEVNSVLAQHDLTDESSPEPFPEFDLPFLKSQIIPSESKSFIWNNMTLWPMRVAAMVPFNSFRRALKGVDSSSATIRDKSDHVCALMFLLTKGFMRSIVKDAVNIYKDEEKAEKEDFETMKVLDKIESDDSQDKNGPPRKLLTPFHVYRAIYEYRLGKYDFLSNTYLEAANSGLEKELIVENRE